MWTKRVLAPVVISLLAAVLAGCGGGDSDQALAERTVLGKEDLPSAGEGLSWYSDGPDEEALVNRCANFDLPGLNVTARASGDSFLASQVGGVTSLSAVYENSAHQALPKLADQTTRCIREERAKGSTWFPGPKSVRVREISLPKVGASSRANEIEYALTGSEDEPPNYDEVVLIQKGRSVVLLWLDPEVGCAGQLCGATPKQKAAFVQRILVELARPLAARM